GLRALPSDEAMELFDAALLLDEPVLAVTYLDTKVLRESPQVHPVLRNLAPAAPARRKSAGGTGSGRAPGLMEQLAVLGAAEREDALEELVRGQVAGVLGHTDASVIDGDRPFQELGFDSLTAVELRNQLNQATGLRLPTTLVFDYPNPTALAGFLAEQIQVDTGALTAPVLADLDRAESVLKGLASDDASRGRLAERLRELLALAGEPATAAAPGAAAPAKGEDEADLDSASDEELFALLDGLE
ncbi:beta-ketoacyl reductase, partial [Streptomyces arboris]